MEDMCYRDTTDISRLGPLVCVFITAGPIAKLCAYFWGAFVSDMC
jgi:hypothetical protein